MYSREAGRFEVKYYELEETIRHLLESEVSLNIPSHVNLLYVLYLTLYAEHCFGHLCFNKVNSDTGIQFQWSEIVRTLK